MNAMKMYTPRNKPTPSAAKDARGPKPFRRPTEDFDLHKASARELALFGLPPKPNVDTHPRLRLLWEELAERRPSFVDPKWKHTRSIRTPGVHDRRSSILDGVPPETLPLITRLMKRSLNSGAAVGELMGSLTSPNWCGAYVSRLPIQRINPRVEPLRVVSGRWVVPRVSVPTAGMFAGKPMEGSYQCAAWVGIDGTAGSKDVLQAGTNSVITAANGEITGTRYYAWIEWYPLVSIPEGLVVTPGDLIACIVCAPLAGNVSGSALLSNLTTNEIVSYPIQPKPGVTLAGNVAEWIIEDPGKGDGSGLLPFANFGQVVFTDCSAGTQNHELNVDNATLIDLTDAGQVPRAQATRLGSTSLSCQFVK